MQMENLVFRFFIMIILGLWVIIHLYCGQQISVNVIICSVQNETLLYICQW